MFILHVALQGCLRGRNVEYGVTADTGGHIRYLLDLIDVSVRDPGVRRIVVATRRFAGPLGDDYSRPLERIGDKAEIVRLDSDSRLYLEKEALHGEVDSFADSLIAYIEAQPMRPDIIHAHYADAASVAAQVKDRLGIPFVFTAHSLGRIKQAALGDEVIPGYAERIASEETALSQADLVIASSRDEAEVQWAGYDAYEAGRIRILPPGSDLTRFAGVTACPDVAASINRFLREPDKPAILAIARPVRKKNLAALVTAFGESPLLQKKANLVIVAGTREDYEQLDGEMAETMGELLRLIDRYDLYGRVAYPKTHRPEDVPFFYAYARERRGFFVNPALSEPFGLTLLEASAAGLPLVATDSGGPNDIIELARNGILVNPRSPHAIAAASLRILDDPALWNRYSKAGAKVAEAYNWNRHVESYHALIASLLARTPPEEKPERLLICDIDNTLVGCAEGINVFRQWRREQERLTFGVATGRSFHSALSILEQQDAPRPQVMVTSVGSEIHHLDANGTTYTQDRAWRDHISWGWDRDGVRTVLAGVSDILPQAPLEQRPHKLSYFSDGSPDIVRRIRTRLEAAGSLCSIVHSHGRYLDILPLRASKGSAVDYVRRLYGLAPEAVVVAGDSGNDIEMLRTMPQAIIVANFSDGLASHPQLRHSYLARGTHALGVIEGYHHFLGKGGVACKPAS